MKHGITAVLAAAALVAAASAQADNDTGFYAGAGVGSFNLDIDNPDDVEETIDALQERRHGLEGILAAGA